VEEYLSEKSIYFRAMLVWISFPSMLLLFFGEPVLLIIAYAALGALFDTSPASNAFVTKLNRTLNLSLK
jgi:hypothetical protein